MEYFIFAKPIVDMFYSLSFLDYIMTAIAGLFFISSLSKLIKQKKLFLIDSCVFVMMGLLFLTLLRTGTGFVNFVKLFSAFAFYFIGRGYYTKLQDTEYALVKSNYVVLLTNLTVLILGFGFIHWGGALTFRGLYYFKSDFGISMIYVITSFVFFDIRDRKMQISQWIVIGILELLSNTRMGMVIFLLILFLWLIFLREQKTKKPLQITFKLIVLSSIIIICFIFLISWILSLPFLKEYHFLSFNINSLSDFYDDSNMQGRNNVWEGIMNIFNHSSSFQKLFGIDFVSDVYINWASTSFESHNGYIKLMFCTGYVGLSIFIVFVLLYLFRLNELKDRSLFYFNLCILITFLLQSFSQSAIAYTQMTWIFFFFSGCGVSKSYYDKENRIYYNSKPAFVLKIR